MDSLLNATLEGSSWNASDHFFNVSRSLGNGSDPTKLHPQYSALILLVIPLMTIFGNGLVVVSVIKIRSLHTPINFFILGLALADCGVAVTVMPFAVYVEYNNGLWLLSNVLCDIYCATDVTCSTSSILLLTVISFDRFTAVTKPIEYATSKNVNRVVVINILVWIFSLSLASPMVLGMNNAVDRVSTECRFYNADYIIYSSMGSFFIPCLITVGLYVRIFQVLRARRHNNMLRFQKSSVIGNPETDEEKEFLSSIQRKDISLCDPRSVTSDTYSESSRHHSSSAPNQNSSERDLPIAPGDMPDFRSRISTNSIFSSATFSSFNGNVEDIDFIDTGIDQPSDSTKETKLSLNSCVLAVPDTMATRESRVTIYINESTVAHQLNHTEAKLAPRLTAKRAAQRLFSDPSKQHLRADESDTKSNSLANRLKSPTADQLAHHDSESFSTDDNSNSTSFRHPMKHVDSRRTLRTRFQGAEQHHHDGLTPDTPDTDDSDKRKRTLRLRERLGRTFSTRKLKKKFIKSQRREKKATKTLAIVLGVFLFCWVPFFLTNFINAICLKLHYESCQIGFLPFFLTTWLGYMNSFMNPGIYTIFSPDFRRAFKQVLTCKV